MTRRMVLSSVSALAAVGAIGIIALKFLDAPVSSVVRGEMRVTIGGPFSLTDQHGRRVSDVSFRGRHMLVFFGFVNCPDVCPTALQNVTLALDRLGDDAKKVVPIFITIDPARDTPDALARYLANFHPNIVGLTGSSAEIAAVAAAYRVAYGRVDEGQTDTYAMFHSAYLYFMGPDGRFLQHFRHSDAPDRIADPIRKHVRR